MQIQSRVTVAEDSYIMANKEFLMQPMDWFGTISAEVT